jgi:hypothetical protein
VNLCTECTQDINLDSSAKSAPVSSESPKVDKPPESSSWESYARSPKALKPKGCTRLPWCWRCSDFSNLCHLGPRHYRYYHKAGTSQVPQSMSPKPLALWTQGYQWVSAWRGLIRASVWRNTATTSTGCKVSVGNREFIQSGFHVEWFITATVDT